MAHDESSSGSAAAGNAMTIDDSAAAVRKPRNPWIPAAVLAIYWAAVNFIAYGDFIDVHRFLSRMLVLLAAIVFCAGWWFANREFRWRDRLLVAGVALMAGVVAGQLAHRSMNYFALFMAGIPWLLTVGIVWLIVSSRLTVAQRRTGLMVAAVLVFGSVTLFRWDGLDGRQRAMFSWRFRPSGEERLLASSAKAAESKPSPSEAVPELSLQPGDWPYFRGLGESSVAGVKLASWQAQPQAIWRKPVGPAWSSMIVINGRLFTQEQRGASEAVVCYDAATGNELWAHTDETRFEEGLSGPGPRGTPTFAEGRVYALGANGKLNCLSAATGDPLWSKEVIKDAGAAVPQWGFSCSPTAVDGMIVAFAGGTDGRGTLQAFNSQTGEKTWTTEAGDQSYSTPQVVTLGGVRQIVMHDNKALFAVALEDGRRLWELKSANEMSVPMLQPHVVGADELLVAWDSGVSMLKVVQQEGKWSVEETWHTIALKPSFNDFVLHDGCVYGLDDGIMCCVDLATQRKKWKGGRYDKGQLLLLPDQGELLVIGEFGLAARVKADPSKHHELFRFQAIEGKTWNHPVIAHGKLYVRNAEEMVCYQLDEPK